MKKNIPYVLVYYLVFIMGYSVIKHFAGWNASTFPQLGGPASNFVGTALAVMAEIILALFVGLIFILSRKTAIGKFIIWSTATVIPVAVIVIFVSHLVLDGLNKKIEKETDAKLHREIIERLPKNIFIKRSGSKDDFSGYVTADNDSLGLIIADTGSMAKVYIYVDSTKLGALDLDSCEPSNSSLQKRLSTYIIPMQTFSSEEIMHNLNYISNNQSFIANRNIYLGACGKQDRRFIIINNVYDKVRRKHCYEIGFEVDCKTPPAQLLELF